MDINTLYKRIERGETTVADAEWLRQYLALLTIKRIREERREVEPVDTAAAMAAADENETW